MSGQKKELERWPGGYVRAGRKGKTFVIERWVGGTRFHVSTRARNLRGAMKQLDRFESDPINYDPRGVLVEKVQISVALCADYRDWMLDKKKNSAAWVANVIRFLAHWREDLGPDHDLRTVSVQRHLKPALARRKTSERHRVESIKGYCAWLRVERGLLKRTEDVTLDLPIPKAAPANITRRRVVAEDVLRAVIQRLPDETADVLALQLGTAWHVSEVRRFAEGGEIVPVAGQKALAVLVTLHKSGKRHNTPLFHQEHVDVAKRIRDRGRIPITEYLCIHMRKACADARVEPFHLGDVRHTVLSYGVEHGATPEQASAFAGHVSPTTTKKFYVDVAVPTASIPVLRLVKA
jgi:hypothetical protein